MPARELPPRPSLERYKKQAKERSPVARFEAAVDAIVAGDHSPAWSIARTTNHYGGTSLGGGTLNSSEQGDYAE